MLISAAHYLGNTPRCGIAQPQCSIESREQINCNCDENLPCEGKTWIGIRHELGRIWPILVNKDETANINDGSLTQFFKGKYNWESADDGWELTNLCPLCQGMKKSSPSVWRWKMTESVRGWKNARSGTSGFHVRPNPQMTPQTRPCLCVASIIVFLCFDNSISLGVPFVFAAFIIALPSVLS